MLIIYPNENMNTFSKKKKKDHFNLTDVKILHQAGNWSSNALAEEFLKVTMNPNH